MGPPLSTSAGSPKAAAAAAVPAGGQRHRADEAAQHRRRGRVGQGQVHHIVNPTDFSLCAENGLVREATPARETIKRCTRPFFPPVIQTFSERERKYKHAF